MNWAIAFTICFCVFNISALTFFLSVYFKELKREKEIMERTEKYNKEISQLLLDPSLASQLYVLPAQKKSKKSQITEQEIEKPKTPKKNFN